MGVVLIVTPEAADKIIDAGGKAIMAPGSLGDAADAPR